MNQEATWAEEDLDLVEALAYTCPLSDGKPVFLARMWYYEETGIRAHNDCEAEMRSAGEGKTENNTSLKVNPNPVQDILYLNFTVPEGTTPDLIVKDLLGNTVKKLSLPTEKAENLPIRFEGFQSGVYFILLQEDNQILISQKIIVVR